MLVLSGMLKKPSKKYPVARYLPKVNKVVSAISDEMPNIKPGFLEQAKVFINNIKQKEKNDNFPKMNDALVAQIFLQKIFKDLI